MNSNHLENPPLFTCESVLNEEEYGAMVEHFPSFYWNCVKNGSICIFILLIVMGLVNDSFIASLGAAIFYELLLLIVYKIRIRTMGKNVFHRLQQKSPVDTHFSIKFYEDYFMRYSQHAIDKIEYSQITRYVETNTAFYLEYKRVFIFQKDKCSPELIDFVRNKCSESLNEVNAHSSKKIYQNTSPDMIHNLMLILFMLTIACLFFGLRTMNYLAGDTAAWSFFKYTWGFWLWLPIPILSIVRGFKYRKAGISCTKNIVAGFIIGAFLLIYGSFCLIPFGDTDYSKIYEYEDLLGITLPAEGDLMLTSYDTYFDYAITDFSEIMVTFENEDCDTMQGEISANSNWIPFDELPSTFKVFLSTEMLASSNSYISIYNHTLNSYNTLPEKSGKYQVTVMLFNTYNNSLMINTFYYDYIQ